MHQRSNRSVYILTAFLAAACAWVVMAESHVVESPVQWRTFADARAKSAESGKPVYVDFGASWCEPCREMEKMTFADARVVQRLNEEFIPVRVDIDDPAEGKALAQQFGVTLIPTSVVIAASGSEKMRYTGFMNPDEFMTWASDTTKKERALWMAPRAALEAAQRKSRPQLMVVVRSPKEANDLPRTLKEPFYLLDVRKRFIVSLANLSDDRERFVVDSLKIDMNVLGSEGRKIVYLAPDGRQQSFLLVGSYLSATELKGFLDRVEGGGEEAEGNLE